MYAPTSPVTGGPQTGFTAPTYTLVLDKAPSLFGIQHAVSALGGTQAGVSIHSISSPFTATFTRPSSFRSYGQVNPVTGKLPTVPKNPWVALVRKGAVPLAGQAPELFSLRLELGVPAGADLAAPSDIRAAVSLLTGLMWQQAAAIGDSLVSGL